MDPDDWPDDFDMDSDEEEEREKVSAWGRAMIR